MRSILLIACLAGALLLVACETRRLNEPADRDDYRQKVQDGPVPIERSR